MISEVFGTCDRLRTCGHGLYDQQIVSGDLSTCAFFWKISDISFSFQHVVPRVEFMNSTRGIVSYSVGSLFSDKSISLFSGSFFYTKKNTAQNILMFFVQYFAIQSKPCRQILGVKKNSLCQKELKCGGNPAFSFH